MQGSVLAAGLGVITAFTAYDAGQDGRGITASGAHVTDGRTLGAAWAHHPPGTWVRVDCDPGGQWRRVEDRGALRGRGEFDLFMSRREDALRWGRRTRRYWVCRRERCPAFPLQEVDDHGM